MEFECETKDYNVAEFHDRFQGELPKIVKVNQGYYGEIAEDVFDRDQVLRIQAIARQKRVISKIKVASHEERLFSIPSSYFEKFCIVKHNNKAGKEKFLFEILRESHLPVTVRFPKDRTITVGNTSVSTNNIPNIEMTQIFDEVSLLGNFITDGVMCLDVVHVPLYLSRLRLAVVTGIKGQTNSRWKSYLEELDGTSSFVEYDQEFGNPNIAEYDPEAIHSNDTYSYVEPQFYSNIVKIMQRPVARGFQEEEPTPQQYQPKHINQTALQNMTLLPEDQDYGGEYEEICNASNSGNATTQTQSISTELKAKLNAGLKKVNDNKARREPGKSGPPLVSPKPKLSRSMPEADEAPELPKRRTNPAPLVKPVLDTHAYSNDVPRTQIHPTIVKQDKPDAMKTPQIPQTTVKVCNVEDVRDVTSAEDVTKLTIEEVIVYMKRLGLGHYEDIFRSEMIDGALLADLDKDILKDDFGMKGVEILKLRKFANEGHVPM